MYCFTEITDPAGLAQIADTLPQDAAAGRLGQACDRWIYTACLVFGLDLAGQRRTCFTYAYSVYQAEYSRNLLFAYGGHMDRVFNAMLDRTRSRLDIPALRTLFGARRRPGKYGEAPSPRVGVALETPAWDLTVFKVHFGLLTLKGCTKGARVLRFEAITHNTRQLGCRRALDRFPQIVARLAGMCQRFCTALDCADTGFIPGGTLDQLPLPAQLGASRVGGIDVNKPRIRAALAAVLALAPSPDGFTVADMTAKVHAMTGQDPRHLQHPPGRLRSAQTPRQAAHQQTPRNPALLPARPGRPDHIGAAHPPGPRYRPDPGRRQDPPARPRPDQADPHRPGLRTSPNRHGHPVQAPWHPARSSHGIASAKPNFWRSWNLKLLAEGKTPKEALRALKRQVSDAIFKHLKADAARAAAAAGAQDPGGQAGNDSVASAAGSHPGCRSSAKPLPGQLPPYDHSLPLRRPRPRGARVPRAAAGQALACPLFLPQGP